MAAVLGPRFLPTGVDPHFLPEHKKNIILVQSRRKTPGTRPGCRVMVASVDWRVNCQTHPRSLSLSQCGNIRAHCRLGRGRAMANSVEIVFTVLLVLFSIFHSVCSVLFWLRRDIQPIKSRFPSLVSVQNVVLLIFFIALCIQSIFQVSCCIHAWCPRLVTFFSSLSSVWLFEHSLISSHLISSHLISPLCLLCVCI